MTGNRCPSDDDRVPDPNALVSGSRWWWLTTAAFAASRVPGRKYHSAVQASTSYGTPQDSAIADRPVFVASATASIAVNETYTVDPSSEMADGTWRFSVRDTWFNDTGYVNSWTLSLCARPARTEALSGPLVGHRARSVRWVPGWRRGEQGRRARRA